ncbi:Hypothetical protein KVN_LOCUS170 [uncultured virus]|nr:Hypothetical protein KVN_LOCUS170 [uncultured virus]
MSLEDLKNKLSTIFNDKKSLWNEFNRSSYCKDKNGLTPSKILINLNKLGYNFTRENFDDFIRLSTFNKSNCLLINNVNYSRKERTKIILIFFTKFEPTVQQINLILNCFPVDPIYKNNFCFRWIEILLDKNYEFSEDQISKISNLGFESYLFYKNKPITFQNLENIVDKFNLENSKEIIKIIKNNNFVPNEICIMKIFNNLFPKNYYSKYLEIQYDFLNFLLELGCIISRNCFEIFKESKCDNLILFKLILTNFKQINDDDLEYFIKEQDIIKILYLIEIKFFEPSETYLNKLLNQNGKYLSNIEHILDEIEKIKNNEWLISDYLNKKHRKYKNSDDEKNIISIIDYFVVKNILPSKQSLDICCKENLEKLIFQLIIKYKIIPDKTNLDDCLKYSTSIKIIKFLVDFKITANCDSIDCLLENYRYDEKDKNKIIEILINSGLLINETYIHKLIDNKILLTNIKRFGISYDENLYFKYHINNLFDKENLDYFRKDLGSNIVDSRLLFKNTTTNYKTIKKLINENNLKFDRYCFENACLFNKNLASELIKNHDIEPTARSLVWYTLTHKKIHENDTVNKMLIKFDLKKNITSDYMKQELN